MDSEKETNKTKKQDTVILSVINQKGGVGKSTTSVNLAAALGEKGYRVLVVDLDPQGNSSTGLGFEKKNCEISTYDCLLNDDVETREAIQEVESENVWLIPANINLSGAENELAQEIARESRLKEALEQIDGEFNFVFVDCPPALGWLTVNALTAADGLIIPIQCEFYSLEGLSKLRETIKGVKIRLNKSLSIFGVLITMFDKRTLLAKQVAEEVSNYYGDKVFETKIPRTVRISEAPSYGEPITQYDPNGKGAEAYRKLADEVVERYESQLSE